MVARIIKGMGGTYFAKMDNQVVEVMPLGKVRKAKLIIGDLVELEKDAYSNKYVVNKVFPRKNELVRPKVANIDQLCMIIASKPAPDYYLIDKLIIHCTIHDIKPILVVNKIDLDNNTNLYNEYKDILPIVFVSAKEGVGLSDLKKLMQGKVTAFAGQSAVGKSTLISALFDVNLQTGDLSKKLERGKHTTRHTELFECGDDIWVMDTPGFSLYELDGVKSQQLQDFYPEFQDYRKECRFSNCVHTTENVTVCGVAKCVKNGLIHPKRYARYVEFYKQLKENEEKY